MGNRGMNISSTFCAVVLILQVMQGSCHEVCPNLNESETYTCQSGTLLFVDRLTFIKSTTSDNEGNCVPDYNTQCGRLQTNNFNEVYLACDKTGPCLVPFHLIPIPGGCGERDSTEAFMEYTCIAATKFNDLCQEIPDASGNDNELYFSTPDYPRLSPFNTGGLCSCSIRGSKITKVRVLDLNVDDMQEGQTSNFVIEDRIHGPLYTKTSRGNTDSLRLIFNEEVSQQLSTSFYINFTHGQSSSRLLVEVKGISLAFRCNIQPTTTAETTEKATTTMTAMPVTPSNTTTTTESNETTSAKPATTHVNSATTAKPATTQTNSTTTAKPVMTQTNSTTTAKPVMTQANAATTAKPGTTQVNAATTVEFKATTTANKTATTSANNANSLSTVNANSHSSADESDSSSTSATISSESSVSTESSSLASSTEPVADKILGLELAAFIGVIVGVVVLLLVIIILIAYCVRSKRNDKERKVWLSNIPQHLRIDDAFDSRLTYNNPGYDDTDGKAAYDGNGAVANDYVTGNVVRSGDNSSGELKDKEKLQNEVIVMENVDYVSQDNCLRSFGKGADAPHCPDERIVHENVEYVSAGDSEGSGNKTGSEVVVLENMEYVSGDDISPQNI